MVEQKLSLELEQETPPNHWAGIIPRRCDICGEDLVGTFVDGRLKSIGTWAIMCTACSVLHSVGLGTGKGQLYNIKGEKLKG